MKGRVTAGIDEYKIFTNRIVKAGTHSEWSLGKDYNTAKIPSQFVITQQQS